MGCLPKHIIFYHDGVSENQFPQVLAQEIPLLRKAIEKLEADPEVTVSFLVHAWKC